MTHHHHHQHEKLKAQILPPPTAIFRRLLKPVLAALLLLPVVCSCEKTAVYPYDDEGFPTLLEYYHESCDLGADVVDADSVVRFARKVDAYTARVPASKETTYYPVILQNISQRLTTLHIRFVADTTQMTIVNIDLNGGSTVDPADMR